MRKQNVWITRLAALLLIIQPVLGVAADPAPLTVFAAASVKNVIDEANVAYQKKTGTAVVASYAASSALAKQIEAGAPADLFISADLEWMDYLQQRDLIRSASRVQLLGNRLVLIAEAKNPVKLKIAPGFKLAEALGTGRLAIGDTAAVPAGKYGKAALESLGVWPGVENKLAQAENVRAALALVARGEAPLGIVYETDAKAEKAVVVVDRFPESSHPPIIYPAAIIATTQNAAAQLYLDYLGSAAADELFRRYGFSTKD